MQSISTYSEEVPTQYAISDAAFVCSCSQQPVSMPILKSIDDIQGVITQMRGRLFVSVIIKYFSLIEHN